MGVQTLEGDYNQMALLRQWEEQAQAAIRSQESEHRRRSATDWCVIRQFAFSVGSSTFNPHLPSGFSFLSTREYRLPGVEVSEHWRTTGRGVGRRVAIRRGSLIFPYIADGNWRQFNIGRSWTSDSRGSALGQDEEKREIDRRLYLIQ